MKLFVVASLAVLAISPAFAQSAPKVVKAKAVAITDTGRTIVRADGAMFIELQPSEMSTQTAQQMYEAANSKIRAGILDSIAEENRKTQTYDMGQRAGLYRNPNTNVPYETFYGVSITDAKVVRGMRYQPTREQRLNLPGTTSYLMTKTDREQGVVGTVECKNPRGPRDVLGYNPKINRGTCGPTIRIFKKLNL